MARLLLHLYGNQNGNRWSSSWSWNHTPVPYCKYGEPGDPPVGCFDLRTAFWHRICLACRTSRLVCKLLNILCVPSKIMAKEVQSRCKQSLKQRCVHKQPEIVSLSQAIAYASFLFMRQDRCSMGEDSGTFQNQIPQCWSSPLMIFSSIFQDPTD